MPPIRFAVLSVAAAIALAGSSAGAAGVAAASAGPAASARTGPVVLISPNFRHAAGAHAVPPTTAFCEAHYQIACYLPQQIEQAYGLPALYAKGVTGKGQTIIIVDSFGSPTVAHDLA